jgi:integrase
MAGLTRPPQPQKIPRNVTARELDRICEALRADYQEKRRQNACRPGELLWLEQAFRFAFLTGLRASEIARLRWGHVDLPRRRLYLFRQKSGREEALPLSRKATALLEALANEFPVGPGVEGEAGEAMGKGELGMSRPSGYVFSSPVGSRSSASCKKRSTASFAGRISRAFTHYRKAAGIQRPVTFHGLRHGFCTTLAEAGKSGPVIQAAARHRELSTAMQYVHLTGDYLRRQLDDAFGEDG